MSVTNDEVEKLKRSIKDGVEVFCNERFNIPSVTAFHVSEHDNDWSVERADSILTSDTCDVVNADEVVFYIRFKEFFVGNKPNTPPPAHLDVCICAKRANPHSSFAFRASVWAFMEPQWGGNSAAVDRFNPAEVPLIVNFLAGCIESFCTYDEMEMPLIEGVANS